MESIIRNPDETKERRDLARFTLDQYMRSQTLITESRFEDIESAAEEANIDNIRWVTSAAAKGRIAMKIAHDVAKKLQPTIPTTPTPVVDPAPNGNPPAGGTPTNP